MTPDELKTVKAIVVAIEALTAAVKDQTATLVRLSSKPPYTEPTIHP